LKGNLRLFNGFATDADENAKARAAASKQVNTCGLDELKQIALIFDIKVRCLVDLFFCSFCVLLCLFVK
jgi:hypothetical protein